jgi:hypothetical protein
MGYIVGQKTQQWRKDIVRKKAKYSPLLRLFTKGQCIAAFVNKASAPVALCLFPEQILNFY